LYHDPIVAALRRNIETADGQRVLNLGSGPFFERELLPDGKLYTLCDIDPRAIELARTRLGSRIAAADVLQPDQPLPYADGAFDLVVSMDVIEHVPDPRPWLAETWRVLRPGGRLFLTTPNYASVSLRVLEATALEVVARAQGFSRKHLHPSKQTAPGLTQLLQSAGYARIDVEPIALGWVLSATAERPA
jgi:SAM-dependent methyltransferase